MSSSEQPPAAPVLRVNLGWALANLLRAYQKQVEVELAGLPGGGRAFLVMSLVERETCHSQVAIAERLGLDKTTLTYLLDGLEKEDLIRRTTDPEDRRSRHITLTGKGAETLVRLAEAIERVEREILSRLTEEEAAQFQLFLAKAAGLGEPSSGPPANGGDSAHLCAVAPAQNGTC